MKEQDIQTAFLRPMMREDLELVLNWRNRENVRSMMYNPNVVTPENHFNWFFNLQNDNSRRFLIYNFKGRDVGTMAFSQINHKTCHWGFYLGVEDVELGTGTLLGYLGLEHAFGPLGLAKVNGEVLALNPASLAFHWRLGFTQEGHYKNHYWRDEEGIDVRAFGIQKMEWDKCRNRVREGLLRSSDKTTKSE